MNFLGLQHTPRQLQVAMELSTRKLPLSHLDTVHVAVHAYFIGYSEVLTIPSKLIAVTKCLLLNSTVTCRCLNLDQKNS